ncbi:hypothetical protein N9948_01585 [bacterium]|nr:hypothetical protein [bacterium]
MSFKNYWDEVNPQLYDGECWFLDNYYVGSADLSEEDALGVKHNLEELAENAYVAGKQDSEQERLTLFSDNINMEDKLQSLQGELTVVKAHNKKLDERISESVATGAGLLNEIYRLTHISQEFYDCLGFYEDDDNLVGLDYCGKKAKKIRQKYKVITEDKDETI